MKYKKTLTSILSVFVLTSILFLGAKELELINPKGQLNIQNLNQVQEYTKNRLNAYYFHTSNRCYTCNLMEKYINEEIKTKFSDETKEGTLVFKAVNVDDPGNEHFAKDYKLYTKSLILSMIKDGKEVKWSNCDRIWTYVKNENKFKQYVNTEIKKYLEE